VVSSYHDARSKCAHKGWTLASVSTSSGWQRTLDLLGRAGCSSAWVGLKITEDGKHTWEDGLPSQANRLLNLWAKKDQSDSASGTRCAVVEKISANDKADERRLQLSECTIDGGKAPDCTVCHQD